MIRAQLSISRVSLCLRSPQEVHFHLRFFRWGVGWGWIKVYGGRCNMKGVTRCGWCSCDNLRNNIRNLRWTRQTLIYELINMHVWNKVLNKFLINTVLAKKVHICRLVIYTIWVDRFMFLLEKTCFHFEHFKFKFANSMTNLWLAGGGGRRFTSPLFILQFSVRF